MKVKDKYLIPDNFKKSGIIYELVAVSEKALIYCQKVNDRIIGYETHKLVLIDSDTYMIAGKQIVTKDKVKLATDEEFGSKAWSYNCLTPAVIKYNELNVII